MGSGDVYKRQMNAQAKAELDAGLIRIKEMELQVKLKELDIKQAEIVGKFENQAEANDIKRDAEAAKDDREREGMAMQFAQTISAQEQAAIAARDPNPVIEEAEND